MKTAIWVARCLGEQCVLNQGCLAEQVYGDRIVAKGIVHRYEVNNRYLDRLTANGLVVAGKSEDELVEMIELQDHPGLSHVSSTLNLLRRREMGIRYLQVL